MRSFTNNALAGTLCLALLMPQALWAHGKDLESVVGRIHDKE